MTKIKPTHTKPELEKRIAHTERMIADVEAFMKHLLEARGRPVGSVQHQREHLAGLKRKLAELKLLRGNGNC